MICLISSSIKSRFSGPTAVVLNLSMMALLGGLPLSSQAHEFWIEPKSYQLPSGQPISASIKNGDNFAGTHFSYLPHRFQHFQVYDQSEHRNIGGRIGDMPAMKDHPENDGLHVFSYISKPNFITYKTIDKFASFAIKQDLGWMLEAHAEKKFPDNNITESYTRYAKSLVTSGHAKGEDLHLGLAFELIALTNPYQRSGHQKSIQYQLIYDQAPLPNTRIDLFYKSLQGDVSVHAYRTDSTGIITFEADKPGSYLLNAVLAKAPTNQQMIDTGALWNTLWTTSTFGVSAP